MLLPQRLLLPSVELPGPLASLLIPSLEGIDNARCLAIASFVIIFYDYFITLDDEVEYFWSGKWSFSRILYFINRYLPQCIIIITLICFVASDLSKEFCDRAIRACFTLSVLAMLAVQALLVLRIWYLFAHSRTARALVIMSYFASALTQSVTLGLSFKDLHSIIIVVPGVPILRLGCTAPPPTNLWRLFVSPMVLHTVLYLFTAYRAVRSQGIEATPLMNRLLRDGGILYFVVFISVNFTAIGAAMIQHPTVNIPAIFSNLMLAINSVCVSRIMLGMRSLAAELISDPALVLNNNNIQLSRVRWRKPEGPSIGETTVDENNETFGVIDIHAETELDMRLARNFRRISERIS